MTVGGDCEAEDVVWVWELVFSVVSILVKSWLLYLEDVGYALLRLLAFEGLRIHRWSLLSGRGLGVLRSRMNASLFPVQRRTCLGGNDLVALLEENGRKGSKTEDWIRTATTILIRLSCHPMSRLAL